MEIVAFVAFFLVGAIAGTSGGLLGMSGGVIAVPSLVLLFNIFEFPQEYLVHTAIGTSLASMVLTALSSTIAHHRHRGVLWPIVVSMIPGLFMGCLLGAFIAQFLSSSILEIVFGIFICFLGAFVLFQKRRKSDIEPPDRSLYTWIGLAIGGISSFLGIGGGTLTVPLLLSHHISEKKAIGTSAATGLLITFLGALGYIYFGLQHSEVPYTLGFIYLPAFVLVGIATIIFAPIGAVLAHRLPSQKLRRIFAGTLIIIGILMTFH